MQSLEVSLVTNLIQCVISRCIVKLQCLHLSTLPLTSTETNKVILLPFTGHCSCQLGAAENTAPARSSRLAVLD